MKKLVLLIGLMVLWFNVLITPAQASWVAPQPPFSLEGNPPEEYFFDEIFPLFQFIRAPVLEIYENQDRSRKYEDLEVCGGKGGPKNQSDYRDYICDNVGDGCDGGEVDLCKRGTDDKVKSGHSSNGSCSVKHINENNPAGTVGTCSYDQKPRTQRDVKGTDFSNAQSLTFPKIQSEANAYDYIGNPDNPITYGSLQLSQNQGDKVISQLMVLKRAKQTKNTLLITKEWPLGWVDWGYQTQNGKTLLQIHDELPDGVSGSGNVIVEGADDFYLNAGNLKAVSDTSEQKEYVIRMVAHAASQNPQPEWVVDLLQTPLHSPSWRQGYVRPSICVWDICRPGTRGDAPPLDGIKRALYFDNSISQAFGAGLDSLFMAYGLDEGISVFNKLAVKNPLIRFATSAAPNAVPSKIIERLSKEIKDPCFKYVSNMYWLRFGIIMDYVNPGDYFDKEKKCPAYQIAPELSKENAGAFYQSSLSALIAATWGRIQDSVDSVVYHTLTIPDAMGQSIQEIQQPVYDTVDSLSELESIKEFNEGISNSVEDDKDNLFGGKPPFQSLRMLPYYSCGDPMFSAQTLTSIEAYARGTRTGCFNTTTVPAGKCDGQLFSKLIENSKYTETSVKGSDYFNNNIKSVLTPELMNTYAQAEKETGVPCEILAGIHFVEADNNPDGSLVSGRKIGTPEPDAGGKVFRSLLETAVYAGDHLKGKVGGNLKDVNTVITGLSRYNGGGNSNCQAGYPYPIPYGGCPRLFEGEDDPYPTSFLDPKHDKMYLLYCADYTACAPQVFERPGSFTVALNVYNNLTKGGYDNSQLPPTQPPPPVVNPPGIITPTPPFFPRSCGPESLSTALGCLPYTRDAFVSALLSFVVGIAGAIALVVMLVATIQIMTAGGDAKKLQAARELFTSAIIGLLFLVFSVSLLRLIAGDIIKLPGF